MRSSTAVQTASRTRPDPWFLTLCVLSLGHFALLASLLVYPEPELNYPFVVGDSIDWLTNAFALVGEDVRYTGRPPLFPLLLAGLESLGLLRFFPVVLQALVHLTLLAVYRVLRSDFGPAVAFVTVLACFCNFSWRRFSVALMADVPAACLLTLAVLLWSRARQRPGLYPAAGLMAGLSAVTQQTALLFPLAAAAYLMSASLRNPSLWQARRGFWAAAAVAFALPTLVWTAIKWIFFDTLGDVLVSHWSVLSPHLDTVDDYAVSLMSWLGLPLTLVAAVGAVQLVGRARRDPWSLFLAVLAATVAGFFVIAYDHAAKRFLVYLLPAVVFAVAEALSRLRRRPALFAAASVWIVVTSCMPAPQATSSRHVALWPLPALYMTMDEQPHRRGGVAVLPKTARLEVAGLDELGEWSLTKRLKTDYEGPRRERLVPLEDLAQDRAAIFLYAPNQAAFRVQLGFHVAMELRKRTHFLPFSAFPKDFFSRRMTVSLLAREDRQALYRAQVAGLDETWLLAATAFGPVDRELARRARAGLGARPQPLGALDDARVLVESIGEEQPVVFLDGDGRDPWRLYLPFLLPRADLLFIEPDQVDATRAALQLSEPTFETGLDQVSGARGWFHGRPWLILETRRLD